MNAKYMIIAAVALAAIAANYVQAQVYGNTISRGPSVPSISVGGGASSSFRAYSAGISEQSYARTSANPLSASGSRPSGSGLSSLAGKARINARQNALINTGRISSRAGINMSSEYGTPNSLRKISQDYSVSKLPPLLSGTSSDFTVNPESLGEVEKTYYSSSLARGQGLTDSGALLSAQKSSEFDSILNTRRGFSNTTSLLTRSRLTSGQKNYYKSALPNTRPW